ncbi:hypothetical protein [Blastococcus montanus]
MGAGRLIDLGVAGWLIRRPPGVRLPVPVVGLRAAPTGEVR